MAARFRKIDPRMWNDQKFRLLSDDAKLLFLFALTHPNMTSVGAMRATVPGMACEMGWEPERFAEAFRELLRNGLLNHDPDASFLLISNYLKYNGPDNPNQVKAWSGAWDLLPECPLKTTLYQRLKQLVERLGEQYAKPFQERFPEPIPNGTPNLELELMAGTGTAEETPTESLSADADERPDLLALEEEWVSQWNATEGIVRNQGKRLTPTRRTAFRARLKSPQWLEQFRAALAKFPLKCTIGDPNGWLPTTDWILKPDSVQLILEGKYDFTKRNGKTAASRVGAGQQYDPNAKEKDKNYGKW